MRHTMTFYGSLDSVMALADAIEKVSNVHVTGFSHVWSNGREAIEMHYEEKEPEHEPEPVLSNDFWGGLCRVCGKHPHEPHSQYCIDCNNWLEDDSPSDYSDYD